MKKAIILLGIVGLLLIGSVFGHMSYNTPARGYGMMNSWNMGIYHEQMEERTFSDLQKLRQDIGFNMMPWVNDEATFKQMQEMHEKMEKYMESNNWEGGMVGTGRFNGHCPMMD